MKKPTLTSPSADAMVTTRVRMERKLYERACALAAMHGQSYAEFITALVDDAVETDAINTRLLNGLERAA